MEIINIKARAKINLYLDVLGRRDDGYHDVSGIMQSIALFDEITIKKVYKPDYLKLVNNLSWLPNDERNLAYQAAKYLIENFGGEQGINAGIFIELNKTIPASAGLGGGSADCAAVLVGVRNLFRLPISNEQLQKIGARFGADVPFCIMRGCAIASGIGDLLAPLPAPPFCFVLLVRPNILVSTGDIFRSLIPAPPPERTAAKMAQAIKNKSYSGMLAQMHNTLEATTAQAYPIIREIKSALMAQGADAAMMSGSGPTVFGLFKRHHAANAALKAIKALYPDFNEIFLTKFYHNEYNYKEVFRK